MSDAPKTAPGRLPSLSTGQMSEAQRRVYEEIAQGPRGGFRGPFPVWLRSPELASRMQRVGEHLRFRGVLPGRLRELAILVTARAWTAQYEWHAHSLLAGKAGLAPEIIAAIAERRRPPSLTAEEAAVHDFCAELHERRTVGEAAFRAALDRLGEEGLVELTILCGYYAAVAMTLNAFGVGLPEGAKPPLK